MTDTTPPILLSLTLPGAIDYATTKTLHITARVKDEGGSGLGYAIVDFDRGLVVTAVDDPDQIGAFGLAPLNAADPWASGFDQVLGIGQYSTPGTYHVTQVVIADGANNRHTYDAAELARLGMPTSFTLSGTTADLTPPRLTGLNLPTVVDARDGLAPTTFTATGSDDLAGINGLLVWLDKGIRIETVPYNTASFLTTTGLDFTNGFKGTWADGQYTFATVLGTPAGIYNITYADLTDKAGNKMHYTAADLAALGINTSMLVQDGTYVPTTLAKTFSVEPRTTGGSGEIVLKLSADQWLAGKNTFSATFTYDPTVAKFDGWHAGANGGYAVRTAVTEAGAAGTVTLTADIDNGGERLDLPTLRFKPASVTGSFAVGVSAAQLNGATLANDFQPHVAFNVPLLREGGPGIDTIQYTGKAADYVLKHDGDTITVKPVGVSGHDEQLSHIERLAFADLSLAFDTTAAQATRLYQAAFDRMPDAAGLGYWIDTLDQGYTLQQVARSFALSDEFAKLYGGNATHAVLVANFYHNVLHRPGDPEGFKYWLDALDHGTTVGQVLVGFSESAENQAQLADLVAQGVPYIPFA
jgi:hypothetical protein